MTCCALAVLIVSQLFLPIRHVMRMLGVGAKFTADQSVMWSPQAAGHSTTPSVETPVSFAQSFALPNFSKRSLILIGGLELMLVAGFVFSWDGFNTTAYAAPVDSRSEGPMTMAEIEAVIHSSICGRLEQNQT